MMPVHTKVGHCPPMDGSRAVLSRIDVDVMKPGQAMVRSHEQRNNGE